MHRPNRFLPGHIVIFLFLACGFMAAGCSSTGDASGGKVSLSEKAVLLKVRFQKQQAENLCGMSALLMLMDYWKIPCKPDQEKKLREIASSREGLSGDDVKKCLDESGFRTFLFSGVLSGDSKSGIIYHLDRGRPLIVMVSSGERKHFLIITGYDPKLERLVYLDPLKGVMALPYSRFEKMWGECQHFSLLAVPARQ